MVTRKPQQHNRSSLFWLQSHVSQEKPPTHSQRLHNDPQTPPHRLREYLQTLAGLLRESEYAKNKNKNSSKLLVFQLTTNEAGKAVNSNAGSARRTEEHSLPAMLEGAQKACHSRWPDFRPNLVTAIAVSSWTARRWVYGGGWRGGRDMESTDAIGRGREGGAVFRVWSSGGVAAAMPKSRNDSFVRRHISGGSLTVLPHNRSP